LSLLWQQQQQQQK